MNESKVSSDGEPPLPNEDMDWSNDFSDCDVAGDGDVDHVVSEFPKKGERDNEKLFVNSDSDITRKESTVLLYSYAQRFKVPQVQLSYLLKLLQTHTGKGAKLPSSKYLLEKHLEPDFSHVKKCLYCDTCEVTVNQSDTECPNCESEINGKNLLRSGKYYLQFDVRHSLRELLEIDEIGSKLLQSFQRRHDTRNTLSDITDGACYKSLELGCYDFTCSINTDGVSVFESSNHSLWPIFLSLNELPYRDRRKHTTLVAMWNGRGKPTFSTFLTNFVEQCNQIATEGITWTHRGKEITSKVLFICICADSGARCYLQGIKQFNGFFSCPWCLIPGETLQLESGGHKTIFPPSDIEHEKRTSDSFKQHLLELYDQIENGRVREDVYGIISFSPFVQLKGLDMVSGFTVDYMHTALLGVLRTFTNMFLDSKNNKNPYYLGPDNQSEVTTRLQHCRVAYEVNRSTRDLSDIAYWKANEWKAWLIVCIPILKGILPEDNLKHLAKFVTGITLLSKDKITHNDISLAEKLLKEFNDEAPELYGKQVCTFNMHIVTHFPDCVRNWGPLWGYSLFQFENENGKLMKMFSGTTKVGMQIARQICIQQAVRSTAASSMVSKEAIQLHKELSHNLKSYKHSVKCDKGVTLVGPRKVYKLNDVETKMLQNQKYSLTDVDTLWSYKHFFVNGRKFCHTQADSKRFCNSIALIAGKYYTIKKIILILYTCGKTLPVVFCNELYSSIHQYLEEAKSVFKVTGKSDKTSIIECKYISNTKFITIVNDDYRPLYLSKLLNSTELE